MSMQISDSISSQMKWDKNELNWFVYVDRDGLDLNAIIWVVSKNGIILYFDNEDVVNEDVVNEDVDFNAIIRVASKNQIKVSIGANESKLITEIEKHLINAFITGSLKVQITQNSTNFIATSMSPCTDLECKYSNETFSYPYNNSVRDLNSILIILAIIIFIFIILLVTFFINFLINREV